MLLDFDSIESLCISDVLQIPTFILSDFCNIALECFGYHLEMKFELKFCDLGNKLVKV